MDYCFDWDDLEAEHLIVVAAVVVALEEVHLSACVCQVVAELMKTFDDDFDAAVVVVVAAAAVAAVDVAVAVADV